MSGILVSIFNAYTTTVLHKLIPSSLPVVLFGVVVDSLFYGSAQITWWNFLQFNLLQGLSQFYGVHRWHWYFTQGLPLLLTTLLPLTITGIWFAFLDKRTNCSPPFERHALLMVAVPIAVFSLLAHKEYRFLYPLLPLCLIWAGRAAQKWASWAWQQKHARYRYCFALIISGIVVSQVVMGIYMGTVHQRGVVDVMRTIATIPESPTGEVLFLTPCHSNPWTSHVNRRDIRMRFLTCEPPIDSSYKDEADLFYEDPIHRFQLDLSNNSSAMPSYIVIFEELLGRKSEKSSFSEQLEQFGYRLYQRHFNSHFIDDDRRVGDVLVYKLRD